MDFKDCLVFKTVRDNGRVAIPRNAIKGIYAKEETNYSTNTKHEVTHLLISVEFAEILGRGEHHIKKCDTVFEYAINDKFEIALGLLRGNKGVEVLFTNE